MKFKKWIRKLIKKEVRRAILVREIERTSNLIDRTTRLIEESELAEGRKLFDTTPPDSPKTPMTWNYPPFVRSPKIENVGPFPVLTGAKPSKRCISQFQDQQPSEVFKEDAKVFAQPADNDTHYC